MTDTNKPPFDALGNTLVIGLCRTGKTRLPLLHTQVEPVFDWKSMQGAHQGLVLAQPREGMVSENDRSGGLE
jgi:hypothetical protein